MDTSITPSGSRIPRNPFTRAFTSHSRHKQTLSDLSSLQSLNSALSARLSQVLPLEEALQSEVTTLTESLNVLSSEGARMKSENDSLRQRLEAAKFLTTGFNTQVEELSKALHQSLANQRVDMWENDTATAKALSTAKEKKAAIMDIMSSLSKRDEIKRFVTDVLQSQVDYATTGDFIFNKDDLVRAMDLDPSINNGSFGWEMRLGIPGSNGYITENLKSPTFGDVNNRYSFKTAESAAMDETVIFLATQGAEALKTLPSTYVYSRPVLEKIQKCDKEAMGQGTLSRLSMITIPWIDETTGKLNVEMGFESRDGYFESTGKPNTIDLGSTLLLGLESWKLE